MDLSITNELLLVTYSLVFGFLIGIFYDVFRVSRLVFHLNTVAVFIEDLAFCIIVAISFFTFTFLFNNGQIRLFVIVSVILGWFIYYFTVGKLVYLLMQKILRAIRKFLLFLKGKQRKFVAKHVEFFEKRKAKKLERLKTAAELKKKKQNEKMNKQNIKKKQNAAIKENRRVKNKKHTAKKNNLPLKQKNIFIDPKKF